VENTFLSIEAVAPALLPVLRPFLGPGKPLGRLLRSKWRNDLAATALAAAGAAAPPVLLMSSLKDEMLPPAHMKQLWFALGGGGEGGPDGGPGGGSGGGKGTVRWVGFPDGRHLDAYEACAGAYWPALVGFAREAGFSVL